MILNSNYINTLKLFQIFGGELENPSSLGISKETLLFLIEANELEQLTENRYRLTPYHTNQWILPPPYCFVGEPLPLYLQGFFGDSCSIGLLSHLQSGTVKTLVELGSWLGQSTLFLAALLPESGKIYAVDHWEGSIEHQKGSPWYGQLPTLYKQFLSNVIHAKQVHKIIPMKMTSLEAAEILDVKPDLVYIDASHEEEDVYQDLKHWYPLAKIVCGDDYDWGANRGYPVRKALKRFCHEEGLSYTHQKEFWTLDPTV